MVSHYLKFIVTNLVAEDFFSILLMEYAISEVSQYDFDVENMTVHPKHVPLPNIKNKSKGISGLEFIENPSRVNIYPILDNREIGSIASG